MCSPPGAPPTMSSPVRGPNPEGPLPPAHPNPRGPSPAARALTCAGRRAAGCTCSRPRPPAPAPPWPRAPHTVVTATRPISPSLPLPGSPFPPSRGEGAAPPPCLGGAHARWYPRAGHERGLAARGGGPWRRAGALRSDWARGPAQAPLACAPPSPGGSHAGLPTPGARMPPWAASARSSFEGQGSLFGVPLALAL